MKAFLILLFAWSSYCSQNNDPPEASNDNKSQEEELEHKRNYIESRREDKKLARECIEIATKWRKMACQVNMFDSESVEEIERVVDDSYIDVDENTDDSKIVVADLLDFSLYEEIPGFRQYAEEFDLYNEVKDYYSDDIKESKWKSESLLYELPRDVWEKISSYFQFDDIWKLQSTCYGLHIEPFVWRSLVSYCAGNRHCIIRKPLPNTYEHMTVNELDLCVFPQG